MLFPSLHLAMCTELELTVELKFEYFAKKYNIVKIVCAPKVLLYKLSFLETNLAFCRETEREITHVVRRSTPLNAHRNKKLFSCPE